MDLQISSQRKCFRGQNFGINPLGLFLSCCSFTVLDNNHKESKGQFNRRNSHTKTIMISNSKPFSIIFSFVGFLILASIFGSVISDPTHVQDAKHHLLTNQTFKPKQELLKLKRLRTYLRKVNKPAVKTIQAIYI